mgnify:CR=1 FL=1
MEEFSANEALRDVPQGEGAVVRTRVTVDNALQKRIFRRVRAVLLGMMIVGLLMLVAYVVLYVVTDEGSTLPDGFWLDALLWFGALCFAMGLVAFISSGRANKKQLSLRLVNEYEFRAEGLVINDYRSDELVSTSRLKYSDFEKIRESKEFFLLYPNRVTVYPVDKTLLSGEECALLRTFFRLPAKGARRV